MFEEHGLNIARQPDNGANPRPDNRSGWLEGETPDVIESYLDDDAERCACTCGTPRRSCATAPRRGRRRDEPTSPRASTSCATRGLHRRTRLINGPQGPRVLLDGAPVLLLCSNNYLGFAEHPRVREAAAEAAMRWGVGAGASRLVSGTMTIHEQLERAARGVRGHARPACCSAPATSPTSACSPRSAAPGATIFSDALNHASIIDGCRLARAETFVYRHCDLEHLEWGLREHRGERRGDRHRLGLLDGRRRRAARGRSSSCARRHGALVVVDEAHATGALGPGGRGAVAEAGLEGEVDVIVGTLSKALGAYGGYVCARREIVELLVNRARTLIFSTAPPPPAVAGALAALELLVEQPRRPEKLQARRGAAAPRARTRAGVAGARRPHADHPVIVGDADAAVALCEALLARGVFAQAIRPPTVPAGSSRLRLTVMASHTATELHGGRRGARDAAARARRRPSPRPRRRAVVRAAPRERLPCAAASSPRPTPASARRSSAPRSSRACARRGVAVRARKPVLTGLDEPTRASAPTTSCSRRVCRRGARGRSRRCATGRRSRRTSPRSSPARPIDVAGARRRRRAAAGTGDRRGHRRPARPARRAAGTCARSPRARPRRARRGAARASARSTTRCSRSRPRAPAASTCAPSC